MGAGRDLVSWSAAQLVWFVPAMLAVVAALLVGLAVLSRRMKRLETHYRQLTSGVDDRDLLAALEHHLERLAAGEERLTAAEARLSQAEEQLRWAMQDFGLVRFDAFDDVGGKVSFAVAMLDDRGEGLVLSSLFGRDGSSTYAKRVGATTREDELSDEEREALQAARQRASARLAGRRAGGGI